MALSLGVAGGTTVPVLADVAAPRARAARGSLDVLPFPGTPDASPQTQIGFPAVRPAQLRRLSVAGSRTGAHSGQLRALPGGRGCTFTPSRPFAPGERVTVRATLSSGAVGTASGAASATQIGYSFDVGIAPTAPAAAVSAIGPRRTIRHDYNRDSNGLTYSVSSEPGLHPPVVFTAGADPDPGAGDIFLDAQNSTEAGPMILDPNGHLIWFEPMHRSAAFNVELQNYRGQSVLTFWQGYVVPPGTGVGTDMILDHTYKTIAQVNAGNGYHADLHEFQITPQGNALISIYSQVQANLSSLGGPRNGKLLDSIIQEVNIATGQVLWEWHAYGHVHLAESYARVPPRGPYDFFHVNSMQQLPNGNLLVSARHTWAVYDINMRTGKIAWALGGKHSSFRVGRGANFEWQHDAHLQGNTLTVFDNGAGQGRGAESRSRGLQIGLNFRTRRATLQRAYTNNPSVLASSQGSVQALSDGNAFVGFGNAPYFTEFDGRGHQVFSLHFSSPLQSYRAYRFPWSGQPTTQPSIAVSPTAQAVDASWNGATGVASWQLLAGSDPSALAPVGQVSDTGFETAIPVSSNNGPFFAVKALDSGGNVLGTSATIEAT